MASIRRLLDQQERCVRTSGICLAEALVTLGAPQQTVPSPVLDVQALVTLGAPQQTVPSPVLDVQELAEEVQSAVPHVNGSVQAPMQRPTAENIPASESNAELAAPLALEVEEAEEKDEEQQERSTAGLRKTFKERQVKSENLSKVRVKNWTLNKMLQQELQTTMVVQSGWFRRLRVQADAIVRHQLFDTLIGFIIAANAFILGFEEEMTLQGADDVILVTGPLEVSFFCVYIIEVILRALAGGRQCLYDPWYLFDLTLVLLGIVGIIMEAFADAETYELLQTILVIRSLRLLRLVRALRMIPLFKMMWRLVYGLITSLYVMISTAALLLISMYIFACIALEIIAKDDRLLNDDETRDIVAYNFASLFRTMVTLTQFVTLDSVAAVYMPLIVAKPGLAVYFTCLVLFISISLMNLVTAVLVESSMEYSAMFKEEDLKYMRSRVKETLPSMIEIFKRLDSDNSGLVSLEEISQVPADLLPKAIMEKASVDGMSELFELLDIDCTGSLSQDEFLEGVLNISIMDIPVSTMQILKHLKLMRHKIHELDETLPQRLASHLTEG
eukprot:TRINITY_DN23532_c0_g1_i1.p1 TRINITY_DN23532_c0_g1~~TRINITY_DN23532_c0_g1_i1.p1  ORF type:complete len:622 (-),score=142.90 TRINITY_DN23532_c0_g1_i1:72-1748(-)